MKTQEYIFGCEADYYENEKKYICEIWVYASNENEALTKYYDAIERYAKDGYNIKPQDNPQMAIPLINEEMHNNIYNKTVEEAEQELDKYGTSILLTHSYYEGE